MYMYFSYIHVYIRFFIHVYILFYHVLSRFIGASESNLNWGEITDLHISQKNCRVVYKVDLSWLFTFKGFLLFNYFFCFHVA